MSYVKKSLTELQLTRLKELVNTSLSNQNNIKWSQKNGYNADNTFLPVEHNLELANFVNSITGYSLKDITSLHFIRYTEGKNLTRHRDQKMLDITNPKKSLSLIFLLEMCEEGGEFFLDDNLVTSYVPGDYVAFDGEATYHEVKEVKKGKREVLVLRTPFTPSIL